MDLIIIGHNISCSYKEESQNKPLTPSILRLMVRKVLPKKTSSFLHFWIAVVLATSIISSNMRVVNSFVTSATSKAMKHRAKNVISSAPKSKHPKLSIPRGGHQPSNSFSSSSSTTSTSLKATSSKTSTVAARDALSEMDKGEFKRTESIWRSWISSEEGAKFPPEAGRYHLFVAYACPWAHRTLIARALKGLEDTISVTVVHPIWQKTRPNDPKDEHAGWVFGKDSIGNGETWKNSKGLGGPFPTSFDGNEPDPFDNDATSIRDYYDLAGDTNGKYTVPILWDKKLNTIVNNESAEIIRMLNSEFNAFAKNPELDIRPDSLIESIDAVNDWIYPRLNNGVYRCGFAQSQAAYDKAITELTDAFDKVENILQKQRFIAGDTFTEADIRLFVTLLRFDEVYVVYFKTNTRSVANSPAILNYCREIYQMPGVKETVNMEQIKAHYYCSHPMLNTYSIIPRGPGFVDLLEQPHNRDNL